MSLCQRAVKMSAKIRAHPCHKERDLQTLLPHKYRMLRTL
jgi:hypothetical protein